MFLNLLNFEINNFTNHWIYTQSFERKTLNWIWFQALVCDLLLWQPLPCAPSEQFCSPVFDDFLLDKRLLFFFDSLVLDFLLRPLLLFLRRLDFFFNPVLLFFLIPFPERLFFFRLDAISWTWGSMSSIN
jgi:hypothetical protein